MSVAQGAKRRNSLESAVPLQPRDHSAVRAQGLLAAMPDIKKRLSVKAFATAQDTALEQFLVPAYIDYASLTAEHNTSDIIFITINA